MSMMTVVILTFNEAKHIERALRSLALLDADVFVVDSFSSDETVELARNGGATVLQNPFVNQAQQFAWALANIPIATEWVMRLDADELLTDDLTAEIRTRLPKLPLETTGVNLKRRHIFLDRWIRRGGRYPVTLLRIWRNGTARVEQRWMDEHMVLTRGRAVTFQHDFSDHNLQDITHFIDKHNKYATREAIEILSAKYQLGASDAGVLARSSSFQARTKRLVKEKIYNRLPLWCGPLGYFLFRYALQRGFMDGREGLIYHTLQGFWYRFLVSSKLAEFEHLLKDTVSTEERLFRLEKLSGLPIASQFDIRRKAATACVVDAREVTPR